MCFSLFVTLVGCLCTRKNKKNTCTSTLHVSMTSSVSDFRSLEKRPFSDPFLSHSISRCGHSDDILRKGLLMGACCAKLQR